MNNAPEASQLMLLSQLSSAAPGTKVRFLGCVNIYDSMSAVLHLKDRFASTAEPSTPGSAIVNVEYVLDALNLELTQVGAWVNVVGYMRSATDVDSESKSSQDPSCLVDAVFIWSAGAIKLDEYEAAVRDLQTATT